MSAAFRLASSGAEGACRGRPAQALAPSPCALRSRGSRAGVVRRRRWRRRASSGAEGACWGRPAQALAPSPCVLRSRGARAGVVRRRRWRLHRASSGAEGARWGRPAQALAPPRVLRSRTPRREWIPIRARISGSVARRPELGPADAPSARAGPSDMGLRAAADARRARRARREMGRRGDAPSDTRRRWMRLRLGSHGGASDVMPSQKLARSAEPPDAGGAVARRSLDATLSARATAARICAPRAV
jgi:hypothetical protein